MHLEADQESGFFREIPWWKRAFDMVCILIAAPLWLPLMAVIAVMVKLCSPGPVLFRQQRIGYRAQAFVCLKFRTMHFNAPTVGHEKHLSNLMSSGAPMVKMDAKGDNRLIPVGWILRSSGLDELPQIFNVMRGDMSLVGPRPCLKYE